MITDFIAGFFQYAICLPVGFLYHSKTDIGSLYITVRQFETFNIGILVDLYHMDIRGVDL